MTASVLISSLYVLDGVGEGERGVSRQEQEVLEGLRQVVATPQGPDRDRLIQRLVGLRAHEVSADCTARLSRLGLAPFGPR